MCRIFIEICGNLLKNRKSHPAYIHTYTFIEHTADTPYKQVYTYPLWRWICTPAKALKSIGAHVPVTFNWYTHIHRYKVQTPTQSSVLHKCQCIRTHTHTHTLTCGAEESNRRRAASAVVSLVVCWFIGIESARAGWKCKGFICEWVFVCCMCTYFLTI